MNIVFMGTPDFAVASLEALVQSEHNVKAVVSSPDKPAGRGQKLRESAVKIFASKHNIPTLQPGNLKDDNFIEELRSYQAELFVVVAFRMLPKKVWSLPSRGTINLHASLLPDYRGAAPINWAIINGEEKTGVTTFFINENIDTGAIILQEEVAIAHNDTAGSLHDKLMSVGAELLVQTTNAIAEDRAPRQQQGSFDPEKKAPKIFKEHLKVDFNREVENVYNHIRGMAPYPAAYATLLNGETQQIVKFYKVNMESAKLTEPPGKLVTDNKKFAKIACKNGFISIEEAQLAGKKRMNIKQLLNGLTLAQNAKMI